MSKRQKQELKTWQEMDYKERFYYVATLMCSQHNCRQCPLVMKTLKNGPACLFSGYHARCGLEFDYFLLDMQRIVANWALENGFTTPATRYPKWESCVPSKDLPEEWWNTHSEFDYFNQPVSEEWAQAHGIEKYETEYDNSHFFLGGEINWKEDINIKEE